MEICVLEPMKSLGFGALVKLGYQRSVKSCVSMPGEIMCIYAHKNLWTINNSFYGLVKGIKLYPFTKDSFPNPCPNQTHFVPGKPTENFPMQIHSQDPFTSSPFPNTS